jgi:hypothetical protein
MEWDKKGVEKYSNSGLNLTTENIRVREREARHEEL